jgi:hypothetical protein
LHVAPILACQSIEVEEGANTVYQFVADISIHCCDETGDFV